MVEAVGKIEGAFSNARSFGLHLGVLPSDGECALMGDVMRVFLPLAMSLWFAGLLGLPLNSAAQNSPLSKREATTPLLREVPLPLFEGQSLPRPPQQDAEWTPAPDSAVPESWNWATRLMFSRGVADPRGCEYRQIEIVVGSVYGSSICPTRGWVLPREAGSEQDFAICWNGLVYPVIKTGERGDFRDDALGFHEDQINQENPIVRRLFPVGEWGMVRGRMAKNTGDTGYPFKMSLLLRLGEPTLARQVSASPPFDSSYGPYFQWARQWAWAMWDRALGAHMRSDDRIAFADLLTLRKVRDEVDREAKIQGLPVPYLPWLEPNFSMLLADQERRSAQPAHRTALQVGLDQFPDPAARIRALIDDLPNIAVRQWGQPGGLESYTTNPIYNALVSTGGAAIEPLLHAWEERGSYLTRSVSFGRDFHSGRSFHPISEPIQEALMAIMEAPPDAFRLIPGGTTPASVREYWKENRDLNPAERSYRMLANDQAGTRAWFMAADEIMRPGNQRRVSKNQIDIVPLQPGETARFAGEELRQKTNPALSELWAHRASQVFPQKLTTVSDVIALIDACRFVRQFARWDASAALPSIRSALEVCYRAANEKPTLTRLSILYLPRFTIHLHEQGDPDALARYCAWLAEARSETQGQPFHPGSWGGDSLQASMHMQLFAPLWMNADHLRIQATIHRLFAAPDAPMATLLADASLRKNLLSELICNPMLRFADVRPFVLRALEDHSEISESRVQAARRRIQQTGHVTRVSSASNTSVDSDLRYRTCDEWTWRLSLWKGMPEMDLAWPEDRRDIACAEAIRVLRGPDPQFVEDESSESRGPRPRPWLAED